MLAIKDYHPDQQDASVCKQVNIHLSAVHESLSSSVHHVLYVAVGVHSLPIHMAITRQISTT
jgi:hypothetical protein